MSDYEDVKIYRITEPSDRDYSYGFLVVQNAIKVTDDDVYREVAKIKEELNDDWSIEDVIEQLPEDWYAYMATEREVYI